MRPYIPLACLQANVDGYYNCADPCNCIDDYNSEDDSDLQDLGLLTREDLQNRDLRSGPGPTFPNLHSTCNDTFIQLVLQQQVRLSTSENRSSMTRTELQPGCELKQGRSSTRPCLKGCLISSRLLGLTTWRLRAASRQSAGVHLLHSSWSDCQEQMFPWQSHSGAHTHSALVGHCCNGSCVRRVGFWSETCNPCR